jgi:salicylate hydroxylase
MRKLWAMMDLSRRGWVSSDRDPIRHWSTGRVTLLGDGAHPTLKTLAQGACMAIEDAVCLGECIAQDSEVAAAFQRYERARTLRTARVQLEGRWLWEGDHADGIARDVGIDTFSRRSEREVYDCLAWLYEGPRLPHPA